MKAREDSDLRRWSSLIRLSHTVFALPFALLSALLASGGAPDPFKLGLVVVAVFFARSAAMAYNRLVDRDIDAQNPRTEMRELPSGALSPTSVRAFVILSGLGFVATSFGLGRLPGLLSLPTLAFLLGYSHAKRFTSLSQFWLGTALGLAAPAAFVALQSNGELELSDGLSAGCLLGLGVALWVAGFDAIYACQDEVFDRGAGLHSLPVRLGRRGALRLSAVTHLLSVACLVGFGRLVDFGWVWSLACAAIALLLVRQQWLAQRSRGETIDPASFAGNGLVGFFALGAGVLEIYG